LRRIGGSTSPGEKGRVEAALVFGRIWDSCRREFRFELQPLDSADYTLYFDELVPRFVANALLGTILEVNDIRMLAM